MDVGVADDFSRDGGRIANASADDQHVVAVLESERLQESCGRTRGEHAGSEHFVDSVRVGRLFVWEKLVARNVAHRNGDGLVVEDVLRSGL